MLGSLIRGTIAGIVASYVLKKVDGLLASEQHEHKGQKQAEDEVFEEERQVIAKATRHLPIDLSPNQREWLARGIRYVLGVGVSMLTSKLRKQVTDKKSSVVGGAVYGITSFVFIDRLLKPFLGIAPPPHVHAAETHARQIFSHAIYGITDVGIRRMLGARSAA